MVEVKNNSRLKPGVFRGLKNRLKLIKGLNLALQWALAEPSVKNIPHVITQDEFTHDVIFEADDWFIVFDTT